MSTTAGFYKKFIPIFLSLVLQNVITLAVNLADNMMLGAYSEAALSGAASANQIQFVLQQLTAAIGEALVVLCSQYWGKRLVGPMRKLGAVAMQTALFIAVLLFVLVSFFPGRTMHIFTSDEGVVREGVRYLSIIRFTYFPFVITQVLLALLRSMAVVRIALALSATTFFVNCGINYVLIYGRFGFPELGTMGAAVGTLSARLIELAVLICFIHLKCRELGLRPSALFHADADLRRDYYRTALPLMLAQGLWGLNIMLQTVILGHMDKAAIAANSVASNIFLLVKSAAMGATSAAAVIIGNGVGSGDYAGVKVNAVRLQKFFVCIGIFSGIMFYLIKGPLLSVYQLSESTRKMTEDFLTVLNVTIIGMSYQMPTGGGIIRGGGDSTFVVKMDLVCIWMIVIPVSLIMAFVVKASPAVVVACLNADQIFKCIPIFIKVNKGNWIRNLSRC